VVGRRSDLDGRSLDEVAAAFARVAERGKHGKVLLSVTDNGLEPRPRAFRDPVGNLIRIEELR
jgi:hypothetical protein